MSLRKTAWLLVGGVAFVGSLCAFQKEFREYPGVEYNDFPLPPDASQPSEWVFARLMYPPAPGARWARSGMNGWPNGNSSWTQDYPPADRHFLTAVRRLTRIDARSVEQPVNLDDGDDVYNWPMLYAVRPGEWNLTDSQAEKMRDYLARGGFFWCDDFWGPYEWQVFMQSMSRVSPGRQPVDIDNKDAIFPHALRSGRSLPGSGLMGRHRRSAGVARDLRRQRPDHRGHHARLRSGRCLGIRRQPALSRAIRDHGHSHRHQLHGLRADALDRLSAELARGSGKRNGDTPRALRNLGKKWGHPAGHPKSFLLSVRDRSVPISFRHT